MEINYGWVNSTTVKRSLVMGREAALVALIVSALVNPLLASAWLTQVYAKLMLQTNRPESRGVYCSPHTSKVMDTETTDVDDDDDDDDENDDVRPIDGNKIDAKNGPGEESANPEDEEEANEDNINDDDDDDDDEEEDEDDDDDDGEDGDEDDEEDEEDEEEALQPPKKRKK